ncbi:hypothetical protein Cgig2_013215 [Carnegiea gigantea]|uniref:Uncharacterized protein n=1 Tax=Carnegiea gigantea TaxID=171969 RepID=A0A9Q1KNR3_9CARY|nr:hypothetical protein Cgig2_013215 [Carnegiea gigantea]
MYWGPSSLSKLGSLIGRPLKIDRPTMEKSWMGYARVLIEVKIGEPLPDGVDFANEKDEKLQGQVIYEWLPIQCSHYKMWAMRNQNVGRKIMLKEFGGLIKGKLPQVWEPRPIDTIESGTRQAVQVTPGNAIDSDGFTRVHKGTAARSLRARNNGDSIIVESLFQGNLRHEHHCVEFQRAKQAP